MCRKNPVRTGGVLIDPTALRITAREDDRSPRRGTSSTSRSCGSERPCGDRVPSEAMLSRERSRPIGAARPAPAPRRAVIHGALRSVQGHSSAHRSDSGRATACPPDGTALCRRGEVVPDRSCGQHRGRSRRQKSPAQTAEPCASLLRDPAAHAPPTSSATLTARPPQTIEGGGSGPAHSPTLSTGTPPSVASAGLCRMMPRRVARPPAP